MSQFFVGTYRKCLSISFVFLALFTLTDVSADELNLNNSSSLMVHGGTGLIQTPTSRMLADGDLRVKYTDVDQYRFWSATVQLYPWMQATVRYTDVRTRLFSSSPGFSGDQTLKDKGIDAKFRLKKESYYWPELSVGFRDFGGTGFFESEFVGLSKKAGDFDFHLNLGWGYLGRAGNATNPFCSLKDSFCERPNGFSGSGGKIDHQRFFRGPASLFGGVEYHTPWAPLSVKLEYEGNDYSQERAGTLQQDSRWNIGAVYRWNNTRFTVDYQRGNTIGFGVSYNFNLHSLKQVKFDKPKREVTPANRPSSSAEPNLYRMTSDMLYDAGFSTADYALSDDTLTLYGQQLNYRDPNEGIERISRIAATEMPDSIKYYKFVETSGTVPMLETVVDAEVFTEEATHQTVFPNIERAFSRGDISSESLESYDPENIAGFFTGVETFWIQTFGNPEAFYLYQGGLLFSAGYSFDGKTSVAGTIKTTLLENFDKFRFTRDAFNTPLHRVRTDVRSYVTNRRNTLENLYLHWHDRIAPNTYAQLYGGYLETMYGGVGGEILYRPVDSNLAFGLDVNYVQQRSYEDDFSFFDYRVLTGHANIYYQPPFLKDTQVTLNIGRYLAKDKGVTVDFAKRFDSGIVVGAFAAFTNVSAEEYGEGSFTKGFYLSIPIDLFLLKSSKGRGRIPWIPIARDGGQPLIRPINLYNVTEARSPFAR